MSPSKQTAAYRRKFMRRASAWGFGRTYEPRGGRAQVIINELRTYVDGEVLDVGAGGNAALFAQEFGARYHPLDIDESYTLVDSRDRHALRAVADIENRSLPFADGEFDTVLCMDVLEHIDDAHLLLDELFRVSRKYVIVSLPNNWPGLLWSLVAGRNITHTAGYGLGAERKLPGQRHKHFFNLEEACDFVIGRTSPSFEMERLDFRFEHGSDGLLGSIPGLTNLYRIAGKSSATDAGDHFGVPGKAVWFGAKAAYYSVRAADSILTGLLYGWGNPARFYNMFCRQIWVVYRRRLDAA